MRIDPPVFVRDPDTGLLVPRHHAARQRYEIGRRQMLRALAATAAAPLVGCGASSDDGPADSGSGADSGVDAADSAREIGPDTMVDAAPDVGGDAAAEAGADADADAAIPRFFRFAVVADTHIIDEWYTGPESNQLDTESMFFTEERFTAARDRIAGLQTPVDFVIHIGDLIHDYPPGDLDFMAANATRADTAKQIMDGFGVPVGFCFGNHDYEFGRVSRDATHDFFRDKYDFEPWSSFDHLGWKFVMLNCYTGATREQGDTYDGMNGSLGEEQLTWLEAELQQGKPTFIFVHQMMQIIAADEVADLGLHRLVADYQDQIAYVLSGHTHRWLDFGTTYGAPHRVIGATRYDEDCFVIAEVDTQGGTARFLNESTWVPYSVESETWQEA